MTEQPGNSANSPKPPPARSGLTWGVIALVVLCATVAFIIYQLPHDSHASEAAPLRRLWAPTVFTPEGTQIVQSDTIRLEFWTPSSKTGDYLAREAGAVRDRDKWEVIPNEERVVQFGQVLRADADVLGYRRAEVWGHGRTTLKPGWWWVTTVTTNYSAEKLVGVYRNFWKSSNAVFVEIFDNRGRN
jgi:hypothetical protein